MNEQRVVRPDEGRKKLAVSPIVCVCFTNHALDQFLNDLIKKGVAEDKIVRVGGRSKDLRLQQRALRSLMMQTQQSFTPAQSRRYGTIKGAAEKLEQQIRNAQLLWTDSIDSAQALNIILEYLEVEDDDIRQAISDGPYGPADASGGFERVRRLSPEEYFEQWLRPTKRRARQPKPPVEQKEEADNNAGSRFEVLATVEEKRLESKEPLEAAPLESDNSDDDNGMRALLFSDTI